MSECQRCRALEARVVELQVEVRALRRTIDDLTGIKGEEEDKTSPLWNWERDDRT